MFGQLQVKRDARGRILTPVGYYRLDKRQKIQKDDLVTNVVWMYWTDTTMEGSLPTEVAEGTNVYIRSLSNKRYKF